RGEEPSPPAHEFLVPPGHRIERSWIDDLEHGITPPVPDGRKDDNAPAPPCRAASRAAPAAPLWPRVLRHKDIPRARAVGERREGARATDRRRTADLRRSHRRSAAPPARTPARRRRAFRALAHRIGRRPRDRKSGV